MGSGGKRVRKNTKKSKAPSSGKNKREELIVVAPKGKERRSHPGAVSGLTNLGNTCFFNAVMQNMAHSYHFRTKLSSLVKSPAYHTELRHPTSEKVVKVNVTQKPGELITNLSNFLSEMQKGGSVLNPRPVFQVICKKSSRFSGYNQQDSQELLRYFLDSLRSEETHRIKHAILTSYGAGAGQKTSFTDQTKSDIRILGMQALSARTFVDDVFGGMLLSTVKCAECANCTTMKESFLDLSLPIAEDKASRDTLHSSHQQDKRKRDTISDGNSQLGKTYSPKKDGDYEQRLSKHQKKKMEREARKSAKKTKKTPKLSPGPVSNSEEGIADDTHQDDILPVDPATGESISEKTRTESQHMLSPETVHVGLQQEHSQDTTHVGLEERPASENICIESCEPATLDAELHEPILEAEPSSNTELSPGTTTQINSRELLPWMHLT